MANPNVSEIPIEKLFKLENIILTGIWFGKGVDLTLYFKPLTDELDDLGQNKINVIIVIKLCEGLFLIIHYLTHCLHSIKFILY